METARRRKNVPRMPPNPVPRLTDWLIDLGITEASGTGAVPISWRELNAWAERTDVLLQPWDARLLRRLSSAYIAESREAESEFRPPPWHDGVTMQERAAEEADLRSVLG